MARVFNEAGIRSTAVWADPEEERRAALADEALPRSGASPPPTAPPTEAYLLYGNRRSFQGMDGHPRE